MTQPSLIPLFCSPVVYVPAGAPPSQETVDLCYTAKEQDSTGVQRSNKGGGWQGRYNFFKDADLISLTQQITDRLLLALSGLVEKPEGLGFSNAWINISPPGSHNSEHIHPGSIFSGVFYVKVPENSGHIWFSADPHRTSEFETYKKTIQKDLNLSGSWSIMPKSGDLLLFPSTLPHGVDVNRSEEDRISVAFNITLSKPAA